METKKYTNENPKREIIEMTVEQQIIYYEMKKELDSKDKVIELMAEQINEDELFDEYCKNKKSTVQCLEWEMNSGCNKCIVQYFENKVKE